MTAYYKATRPDGTDFFTGRVRYAVGKCVRPRPHSGQRYICGPGYLHAADAPAETLVGGRWPCRLFEVTGTPAVGFDEHYPHKGAFRKLTVVRELPSHLALGPNGEAVAALIDRSWRLTRDEARRLDAAWGAAWGAALAYDAAWGAAWEAARGAARGARVAARDAASFSAWDAARDAARDAATALVVRDLITDNEFNALYGPWASVIEDVSA